MYTKKHTTKNIYLNLLFICLSLLLLTGMGSRPPLVGWPAPIFNLNNSEGKLVDLRDFRGKVVLLTFWATWCTACKTEMPEIIKAYEEYKHMGFEVLAINFSEKKDRVNEYILNNNLPFPVLIDKKATISSYYGVINLPVSFFIDKNGTIRKQVIGASLTAEKIGNIIAILKETGNDESKTSKVEKKTKRVKSAFDRNLSYKPF